ncbi:MAG: hypothetical protein IJ555_11170 [Ruminococcus sp.]|nr:hypothetical protein [Ruminococcus sp.]
MASRHEESMKFGELEVAQPAAVKFTASKIWSENAGRGASILAVGDIRGIKKTISLSWFHLSPEQVREIDDYISNADRPFFDITLIDNEGIYRTYTVYAGDVTYEIRGWDENRRFCKGVSVDLIEQ